MPDYVNNYQNTEDPLIYGGNAMFDLWVQGLQDQVVCERLEVLEDRLAGELLPRTES